MKPDVFHMDCALNLMNGVMKAYNECSWEEYEAVIVQAVQNGRFPLEEARERGWVRLLWCSWHINRAVSSCLSEKVSGDDQLDQDTKIRFVKVLFRLAQTAEHGTLLRHRWTGLRRSCHLLIPRALSRKVPLFPRKEPIEM